MNHLMGTRNLFDIPHILLVSQKVKDIKVPPNGDLERRMGSLRAWLHRHSFIPGDKVPATLTPQSIEHGVLVADISGKLLSSDLDTNALIRQRFPLFLTDYSGPLEIESVFSKVTGTRVDDGGNIQNMIVNVAIAMAGLAPRLQEFCGDRTPRITVASSSDPFSSLSPDLSVALHKVCDTYTLNI